MLDQHPRIKELQAQIGEIDRQMQVEGERLARQLDNDAKVAGDRLAALDREPRSGQEARIADQRAGRAVARARARSQDAARPARIPIWRNTARPSARDNINAAPPEARIISRATPAIKPTYPKKMPTVLIAAFAAFALSAGFTVTGALLAAPSGSYAYVRYRHPLTLRRPDAAHGAAPMMPSLPQMASPPIVAGCAAAVAAASAAVAGQQRRTDCARACDRAGEAGRRVTVVGTRAMSARLMRRSRWRARWRKEANVVLVDLAFGAPNLSVISTDPNAPGIAELVRGTASFGEIITRDQFSSVHLVADRQCRRRWCGACRLADAGDRDRGAGAKLRPCRDRCRLRARMWRSSTLCRWRTRAVLVAADPAERGDAGGARSADAWPALAM